MLFNFLLTSLFSSIYYFCLYENSKDNNKFARPDTIFIFGIRYSCYTVALQLYRKEPGNFLPGSRNMH